MTTKKHRHSAFLDRMCRELFANGGPMLPTALRPKIDFDKLCSKEWQSKGWLPTKPCDPPLPRERRHLHLKTKDRSYDTTQELEMDREDPCLLREQRRLVKTWGRP